MELDLTSLRSKTLDIREELRSKGYRVQTVLLFGSHAKMKASAESDIDLAFVSNDFGKDPFVESALLNRLLFGRISQAEGVAVPLRDYLDPFPLSPIVWEIKKHGIPLF